MAVVGGQSSLSVDDGGVALYLLHLVGQLRDGSNVEAINLQSRTDNYARVASPFQETLFIALVVNVDYSVMLCIHDLIIYKIE